MKSMTGFGASQKIGGGLDIEVQVKSVNGRFLDIKFTMPSEYNSLEPEIKNKIAQSFARGSVQVSVFRRIEPKTTSSQLLVNAIRAKQWIEGYQTLGRELKLMADPSLDMVARIPDVLTFVSDSKIGPEEPKLILHCLDEAIGQCAKGRAKEGQAIHKELTSSLKNLEKLTRELFALSKTNKTEATKSLRKKMETLGFKAQSDEGRVAQELALLIEKSDVSEELQRLHEHLGNLKQIFNEDGPQGKKADFYTQELLREFNTIGSKIHLAKATKVVVNAKSLVEQLREQVQNIE